MEFIKFNSKLKFDFFKPSQTRTRREIQPTYYNKLLGVFVTIINPCVHMFSYKKKWYEANNLIENECIMDIEWW